MFLYFQFFYSKKILIFHTLFQYLVGLQLGGQEGQKVPDFIPSSSVGGAFHNPIKIKVLLSIIFENKLYKL